MPETTGRLNAGRAVGYSGELGDGGPGPSAEWKTCDGDHDGWNDLEDHCRDQPGQLHGCPDVDRDGVRDSEDNCPVAANAAQTDADSDGLGDPCDPMPRGEDADGDSKGALDDRCPDVAGFTSDGCPPIQAPPGGGDDQPPKPPSPTPTPTPIPTPPTTAATRILDLAAVVTPSRCPRGHPRCKKAAKVTVKLSRRATVALKLEMRVKVRGRWIWKRVTTKSVTATASGRSLTIRGKSGRSLAKGPYRVTATVAGAAKTKTAFSFRV